MLRPNDLLAENKDQSQRFSSSTNYWQGWSRTYNLWVLNICQSSSLHKLLDKVGRLQIFRDKFFTLLRKLSDSPIQENPIRFFFYWKGRNQPTFKLDQGHRQLRVRICGGGGPYMLQIIIIIIFDLLQYTDMSYYHSCITY